jgi:hypothetical protein
MTARLTITSATLALATAAAGCGDDSEKQSSAPSTTTTTSAAATHKATPDERRAVKATVHRYLSALKARDAKRYCSAFSQSQRDFIAQSQTADNCVAGQRKAWKEAEGQFGASRLSRLYAVYARSEVFDVEVTGDDATAGLDVSPEAGPLLNADSVSLTREGGRWVIDNEIGRD